MRPTRSRTSATNRFRTIVASLAALTAFVAVAPAAEAASAKVPRSFFGVQSWLDPTPQDADMMAGNIGTFRVNLLWSVVEPVPAMRNWQPFDEIVRRAADARVQLLPVILASPMHVAAKYQYPPNTPAGFAAYDLFVHDAVVRYGVGGTFWAEHPQLPQLPIMAWQVWNEPNFPAYWFGKPNAKQYVSLLKRTRKQVKAVNPKAKIILAGIPETKYPGSMKMTNFLEKVYKVKGSKALFDAVAIHPYARKPSGVMKSVRSARKVMKRYKDGNTQVFLTEVGWATAGKKNPFRTTEAGQATRLEQTLVSLVKNRKSSKIGMVVWFSLKDRAPDPGESNWWALNTGLIGQSGAPKPAWNRLIKVIQRYT